MSPRFHLMKSHPAPSRSGKTRKLYFGLDKFLPYFDFIGDFNHVQAHSEALLRRARVWHEYGASGWGLDGQQAFFKRCVHVSAVDADEVHVYMCGV